MIFYSPYIRAEMLRSYKWDGSGSGWDLCVGLLYCGANKWMDGLVWAGNLCVGLLYEHRFVVLIMNIF